MRRKVFRRDAPRTADASSRFRSTISNANAEGIAAVLDQQFAYAGQILDAGLVPIIEPEVDIHSADKAEAEGLLRDGIVERLKDVAGDRQVMLKLSIPTEDDFYTELIEHPKVLRVVALSGGYSRQEADARLARNHHLIASFSRALTEGLSRQQSDADFDRTLEESIAEIYAASTT